MKRAIIIINAYSTLPTGLNQAKRLKSEFSRLGVDVEIRRNGFFATVGEKIESGLSGFDFAYTWTRTSTLPPFSKRRAYGFSTAIPQ